MRKIDWHDVLLVFLTTFLMLFVSFVALAYADVLDIARIEIGNGEIGSNNSGEHVMKYNNGFKGAWCAGFVSWVYHTAENAKKALNGTISATEPYLPILSARALSAQFKRTSEPIPGGVVTFWRGSPDGWQGHIGIIEEEFSVGDVKYIRVIEGNKGDYPALVKRSDYRRDDKHILGFGVSFDSRIF